MFILALGNRCIFDILILKDYYGSIIQIIAKIAIINDKKTRELN
jgi:hypothetical protein